MKKKLFVVLLSMALGLSACEVMPADSPIQIGGGSSDFLVPPKQEIPISEPIDDPIMGEELTEEESTEEEEETEEESETPELEPGGEKKPITERVVKDGKIQSYLTGEWKDEKIAKRRNIAVMMPNNFKAGYEEDSPKLHQYGISKASIIYEAPVEGRITRLMAIFEDYDKLDKIGPVRSSRDYYIYQALSFDSIYVNWGLARPWVEELINSDKVDNISASVAGIYNGYDDAFFRDTDAIKGGATEFTGYLKVDKISDAMAARGYSSAYRESFEQAFLFADDLRATYDDLPDATLIWPGGKENNEGGYGNYGEDNVCFKYSHKKHKYYRFQYGEPMIDNMNQEQVAVTNVIFKISHGEERLPDDPNYDYLAFEIHGTGDCLIFTNGKVIKGTWEKAEDDSTDHYYDESGNEIILNQGKTWLCTIWKEFEEYITYEAPKEGDDDYFEIEESTEQAVG